MDIIQALFLSIVEGITEFLPISSTGHLILAARFLQVQQTEFVKSFEIIIQLGAILAIVYLYWKDFSKGSKIWKNVIIAFIPTGVVGLLLYKIVKNYLLGDSLITVVMLFLGGIILLFVDKYFKETKQTISKIEDLSYKQALVVGVAQSISIVPGVSRAAATIIGGMALGMRKKTAVEFSFLLAVPTLIAASGFDLVKSSHHFSSSELLLLAVGFIGAFITAIMAVKFFVKYVQTHSFAGFGVYRIIIAVLFWLFVLRKYPS